jgi:actin-related protein
MRRTPGSALGWIVVGSLLSLEAFALDCPPNSTDPKCKEQLRQQQLQQQQLQQQQAQQKAQQEAQQKALLQQQQMKAQQEAQQKALQAQQKAAQEKAQQEAQQKAQQQRAQQEAQQKAQQQKAQQEAQQKAQQQKAQQEAQQKAQQQKAQQEAQQKAQQQKAQQEAQQKAQQQKAQQPQPPPLQKQQAQQPPPVPAASAKTPQPPAVQAQPRTAPASPAVAQQPPPSTRTASQPTATVAPVPPPTVKSTYQPATMTPTGRSLYQPPAAPATKAALTPAPVPAAPRVPISTTTAVVPRADRSGYTIQHQAKDGSQVVVTQRKLPTGAVQAVAYKESADTRLGTSTRVYSDGHRVVVGRDYQSYSLYGGPTYVTYKTGLRSAMLPTGKPIFRETFTTVRAADGRDVKVIQKTVYVNQYYGRPVVLATPVVRVYEETIVYGRPAYFYRPLYYEPMFYRTFWVPLAAPVVVNDSCYMCPSRAVAFASPPTRYESPIDLVGDLQLSSAFEESAVRSGTDSTQYTEVRSQMSELTRNVSARLESDPSLRQQMGGAGPDLQKVNQAMNELAPVQVPDEVRQQVRAQVRLTIAQLQNQHPAIVSDVVKSGYAKIFLFQTAAPLNVADAATGEECFINTGDLLGFSVVPTGESPVAQMRVVTSSAQSCQPKQVVNVPLTDLQDMLNAFAERTEDNLKRVNQCISTPSACVRT